MREFFGKMDYYQFVYNKKRSNKFRSKRWAIHIRKTFQRFIFERMHKLEDVQYMIIGDFEDLPIGKSALMYLKLKEPVSRKWFSNVVRKGNRICGLRMVKNWTNTERSYVDCCKRGGVYFEYSIMVKPKKRKTRQIPEMSYSEEGQTLGDGRGLTWNGHQYEYGNYILFRELIMMW